MKVRDVMKTSLRIAQYDSGLTAVARLMYESCWTVLRGVEIDLRVLRVIANRDICIVGGTMSQTIANILVGEVILGKFFACSPDHDIKTVLGIMKQANLQHLPVVNRNGSVRGMISISDAGLRAEQTACAGETGFSYQEVVDTSSSICEPPASGLAGGGTAGGKRNRR